MTHFILAPASTRSPLSVVNKKSAKTDEERTQEWDNFKTSKTEKNLKWKQELCQHYHCTFWRGTDWCCLREDECDFLHGGWDKRYDKADNWNAGKTHYVIQNAGYQEYERYPGTFDEETTALIKRHEDSIVKNKGNSGGNQYKPEYEKEKLERKAGDEEKAFADFGKRFKWDKSSSSDKAEDKEEETWQGREKKRVSFEDQAVPAFNPPEISPSAELQALALESQALKEKADVATSIEETKEIMALYMKKLERTQTLSALLIEEALRVRKND